MSVFAMHPAFVSEVGRRENNEDAVFASPRLVAVADGVGGAAAGEIASRLTMLKIMALDKRRLVGSLEQELGDAIADANGVIAFAAWCEPRHVGMATTLTAVALSNDGAYLVANVGDSRTYLLRDEHLQRLTRDDSLVQQLIDQGALSEADASRHPHRSVVVEVLDGVERALPSVRSVPAREGDRLLLCSDGVTDYLTDAEITELLRIEDAAFAVRRLVGAAMDHGSRDNVTALIADVVTSTDARDGWLDSLPVAGDRV
jgi:PPM family protein phosphatase